METGWHPFHFTLNDLTLWTKGNSCCLHSILIHLIVVLDDFLWCICTQRASLLFACEERIKIIMQTKILKDLSIIHKCPKVNSVITCQAPCQLRSRHS